jgi:DNA-binding MarR family transcriptional regulator
MPKELDFSVTENCVCFNLRWASRMMTKFFDAELRRHGIRANQSTILIVLKAKESWSMADLSEALGMERTTLVRNLQPLQRDGLATSQGGGRGGRVELAITPKGRKQIEKIMPAWCAAQSAAVKTIGAQRWSAIIADLETAAATLEK